MDHSITDNMVAGSAPMPELVASISSKPVLSIGASDHIKILWGAVILQKSGNRILSFEAPRNAYILLYVNKGKLTLNVEGEDHVAYPGQALITLPHEKCFGTEPHQEEFRCQWVCFELKRFRQRGSKAIHIPRLSKTADPETVRELFRILIEDYHRHKPADVESIALDSPGSKHLLISLLSRLTAAEPAPALPTNALTLLAERARSFMRTEPDKAITVADIANHLECSREYLRRAFHQAYGVSPQRYLISLRMRRAALLLIDSHMTVAQIAKECGYEDQNYFGRVFLREYGTTPGQYRIAHGREHLTGGI